MYRHKLQIANDGSYKPISGYNHHVHPKPHPAFDEMPESFQKAVPEISKDYQHGLFRTEIDEFERKPFFVHTPTVSSH